MNGQVLAAPPLAGARPYLLTSNADDRPRWREGERLHHVFETTCDANPDGIAVETLSGGLSFAQIEARANQLARYLLTRGLIPGDVVALLFDRSAESYIAMLAVLKIGAAYVPLDPGFPADRIAYIGEDAGVRAVLTMGDFACLGASAAEMLIALDRDSAEIAQMPPTRLTGVPFSSELAYIIYTSGSTGRPKGVAIDHAMIVNFVRVAEECYGYQPGDRVYQGLTLAFDFSVEEIWVPLLAGATLVPNQSGASLVGEDLYDFLKEKRISALCCVPTLLATVEPTLPDLRLIIVSGEACPADLAARWHQRGRVLLNAYGPTETTVTATIARLMPDTPITIGAPLPTYSVAILKPDTAEVLPQGEVGEIAIAGIGVSRGYIGRDDLTAAVFIKDIFGMPENASGRVYRSGDLGRIDDQGRIVYMGRIDTQVKIRGYRIELDEIETVMLQVAGVRQAVVTTYTPEGQETELAAYFTGTITAEKLAGELRRKLPPFMVPAFFEKLAAIPMLPSDKADRKALPAPSGRRLVQEATEYEAPLAGKEADMAEILGGLLKVERVSATADFFLELGANSLLMARFAAQLRKSGLAKGIAIKDLYQHSSLRDLSAHLAHSDDQTTPFKRDVQVHKPTLLQYWGTGVFQLLAVFSYLWLGSWVTIHGISWTFNAETVLTTYLHACAVALGGFLLFSLLPIVVKWLLVGRWTPQSFPLWSWAYCRFWLVKSLIRTSPIGLMPGTPLYNLHLRLLGADVAWTAMIQSAAPVATDLFHAGKDAVIGRDVLASGYVARDGYMHIGSVHVGDRAFVGDGSVLEINTCLPNDAELGHASALAEGQSLEAGRSYYGNPVQPAKGFFRTLSNHPISATRRVLHALSAVVAVVCIFGPMPVLLYHYIMPDQARLPSEGAPVSVIPVDTLIVIEEIVLGAGALFFAGTLLLIMMMLVVPRLSFAFLQEGRSYPLYGVRHYLLNVTRVWSNSKFICGLFGDSYFAVPWLRAVGYRFPDAVNTGTNFGMEQKHDVPFLYEFGSGTMVSDGLMAANAEYSAGQFRLGAVRFGKNSFLGNALFATPEMALGDDVLLGTKVHIPIHGRKRTGVGLLGSPEFEIPRSVQRDMTFEQYDDPVVRAERLRAKTRYNLVSMAYYLALGWSRLAIAGLIAHFLMFYLGLWSAGGLALTTMAIFVVGALWGGVVERLFVRYALHMKERVCSIYDDYFWRHERYWKLSATTALTPFNGTPLKSLVWRIAGVSVGRCLYDDGVSISEKPLVRIGDHCTFNAGSALQGHSLEDGCFKSGPIEVGDQVTLGVNSFVHYSTTLEDRSTVQSDAFVLKGETLEAQTVWGGNPAKCESLQHHLALPQMLELTAAIPFPNGAGNSQVRPEVAARAGSNIASHAVSGAP